MATAATFSGWRALVWDLATKPSLHFLLPSSALLQKKLRICELPHIGAAKKMRALIAPSSTQAEGNAHAYHIHRNRHRGRNWPDLVGRRDVQVGPTGRLRNEVGRDMGAS